MKKKLTVLLIILIFIIMLVGIKMFVKYKNNTFIENSIEKYLPNSKVKVKNVYDLVIDKQYYEIKILRYSNKLIENDYMSKEVFIDNLSINDEVKVYDFTFEESLIFKGIDLSETTRHFPFLFYDNWGRMFVDIETKEILRFEVSHYNK